MGQHIHPSPDIGTACAPPPPRMDRVEPDGPDDSRDPAFGAAKEPRDNRVHSRSRLLPTTSTITTVVGRIARPTHAETVIRVLTSVGILLVKWVTTLAVGLVPVNCPDLLGSHSSEYVDTPSDRFHVGWIHARWDAAEVVNLQPVGDWPAQQLVDHTVSKRLTGSREGAGEDTTIAQPVGIAIPEPTASVGFVGNLRFASFPKASHCGGLHLDILRRPSWKSICVSPFKHHMIDTNARR